MKCDFQASFLACTFTNTSKVKVATILDVMQGNPNNDKGVNTINFLTIE
jgi:hypothetical protein